MNPFLTCSPLPHPLHRSAIRSPHRQSHCRPIWAIYAVLKPSKLVPKANAVGDVWEFTQEMKNTHPAAFPVKLIDRIIGSTAGSVILDPFVGSGTTAISALNFGRHYIGIPPAY